jgi:hypothetical protein
LLAAAASKPVRASSATASGLFREGGSTALVEFSAAFPAFLQEEHVVSARPSGIRTPCAASLDVGLVSDSVVPTSRPSSRFGRRRHHGDH